MSRVWVLRSGRHASPAPGARQASAYWLTPILNARGVTCRFARIWANIGHGAASGDREEMRPDRRTDVYGEMLGADVKRSWH
jgi:hypothetical protein